MRVKHKNAQLERMERERDCTGGWAHEIVRAFRKQMQSIRAAIDERDIRAIPGDHFEKLSGARSHQRSIRLNKQWRLIIEFTQSEDEPVANIVAIEDYHR